MYYYNVQIKCNIPVNGALIRECIMRANKFKERLLERLNDYRDYHYEGYLNLPICIGDCSWFIDNSTDSKRTIIKVTFTAKIKSHAAELDEESFKPVINKMINETINGDKIELIVVDKEHKLDFEDLLNMNLDEINDSEDKGDDCSDYEEEEDELEHLALAENEPNTDDVKTMASEDNAEEKLNSMIGLKDVKNVIKELVAAARVRKMREEIGLPVLANSMHMIYTGNPGTAKTTVARLLAGILSKYGIIKENKFIECGRSSLVGEFVGHTAPKVTAKFDAAKGGILFIDEAYSLVGEGKDFGDEAITTIVQEMENHRNDVIVIFAGYPDRMKAFLDQNDGLKSRIKYHFEFPDYNENELLLILKLMLKDNGYIIDEETSEKCLGIFKQAKTIHNFGNGRFVRNIFEQAVTQQALRILAKAGKKLVTKKQLMTLKAEDFKQPLVKNIEVKRPARIGFSLVNSSKYSKAE